MRAPTRLVSIVAAYSLLFSQTLAIKAAAGILKVPDGTMVRLSLLDSLSSATNQVDDPVNLEVTEDVKVGEIVAIPRGATARGHVVEVEPKKRLGRAGKLNFTVDNVKAPDGSNLRVRASSLRKGEDKSGTVIVGTVLLSGLFLLMHGKDVEIPKGTAFNAYVDGDREIALGGLPAPQTISGVSTRTVATSPTAVVPTAMPTIVLVDPGVTSSGDKIDVTTPTLTIRGVVTDPSGIPAVTINGIPVSMLPKGPQAAGFTSEPLKLQPGENAFEVVATNAAHLQAKVSFIARYTASAVVPAKVVTRTPTNGLSKGDILGLLSGGVPSSRMVGLVNERGITFTPTESDIKDIRAAGGGDDLVNALKARR